MAVAKTVTALPRIIDGLRGAGLSWCLFRRCSARLEPTRCLPRLRRPLDGAPAPWCSTRSACCGWSLRPFASPRSRAITGRFAVIVLAVLHKRRPKPPLTSDSGLS
jgi:hypothetical protein